MLAPEEEQKAVTLVADRLANLFPDVAADDVRDVVHRTYASFNGNPIRDFVPVLVERMARNDLRGRASGYSV